MVETAIALHVLAAVIWIGGMFFAMQCLRPSLGAVANPAERMALVRATLQRFFGWVWSAVIILPVTGIWMAATLYPDGWPHSVIAMLVLGLVMIALFLHVFFAPWRRFRRSLEETDERAAAMAMASIRRFVSINLLLGIIIVIVASAGRFIRF